ncbi:MAG: lipoprotein insertase outer membrane protein LolB [Pseudomonadota bacterium]
MRGALVMVLAATLTACVTRGVQELPLLPDWPVRQATLSELETWTLRGRVRIATPEESSNGNLYWAQSGASFVADIDGPLGIGGVHIEGDPSAVTLAGSRIETRTVPDPGRELYAQTGVRVPIEGLRYWLLGIPIPGVDAAIELDSDDVAQTIHQSGWRIDYPDYRRWNVNLLPRRITAEYADTRLIIVVGDWDIREQEAP